MRRRDKQEALPAEEALSDLDDAEAALAERLDGSHYRDDVLRLLFICCHPDLPATQQIALALRIVSGLTVKQIARAFLVSETAMEQRITRAKSRIADADVPFETPGAVERAERLAAVAAMIYLVFNEGYSATGDTVPMRAPLCDEAIRLARLLMRLFPSEPEIMGLAALMLLQHARAPARFDADGVHRASGGAGSRPLGPHHDRRGARAPRQGGAPPKSGAVSGAGGDRGAARPSRAARRHRLGGDRRSLRDAGAIAALARGHAQSGGRGRKNPRPGGRHWR